MVNQADQPAENAWVIFSFAASGYSVTIQAAILPVYFQQVLASGIELAKAISYWGYASAFSLLLIALVAPFWGSLADLTGQHKRFLRIANVVAIVSSTALAFVGVGQWIIALVLYIISAISNGLGYVMADSLLPRLASGKHAVRLSIRSYAWTYLGGLLTLALALVMIMVVFPGSVWGPRATFAGISIWWIAFSLMALKKLPETEPMPLESRGDENLLSATFSQGINVFKELATQRKNAFLLLSAMGLYAGAIGGISQMAMVFGLEIGIGNTELIGALALNSLVSFVFLSLIERSIEHIDEKTAITTGLVIYTLITFIGYFMHTAWVFWMLAVLVGIVQGLVMGITRGLFSKFVTQEKSGQMFGAYAVAQRFSSFLGPFIFAQAGILFGSVRLGMLTLLVLFLAGRAILLFVDQDTPTTEPAAPTGEQPAA